MGEMKRLWEILDDMFRPMCPKCGYIQPQDPSRNYCLYCEMPADHCQCDTAHMCQCGED